MKIKFAVLLILMLAVNSFAQSEIFTVDISLKENNWWKIGINNLLTVKVINKSEQILDTKKFEYLTLYFSKCSKIEWCVGQEDKFVSYPAIERKLLKKNELLEFEINLADLYWSGMNSSFIDMKHPKNISIIPFLNKYLYADVAILRVDSNKKEKSSRCPLYDRYESNEIVFDLKYKSSK